MLKGYRWVWIVAALAIASLAGCGSPASGPTGQPAPTNPVPTTSAAETPSRTPTMVATPASVPTATPETSMLSPVPTPTATPTITPTNTPTPEPSGPPTITTVQIAEGSKARYLVREQFARLDFPNDAIGETSEVEGAIVLDSNGAAQPENSKITVNVKTLRSDEDDRDDFLRTEALETDRFPLVEFVVEQTPGLPWPLPEGEEFQFQLQGSMTAHGVTSPVTWEASARVSSGAVTGQARTNFTFDKFNMEKPSVFFLVSVDDNIRLEIDFIATLTAGDGP